MRKKERLARNMSLSEGVYKQTEAKKQTQPPGKLGLPLDHLFS